MAKQISADFEKTSLFNDYSTLFFNFHNKPCWHLSYIFSILHHSFCHKKQVSVDSKKNFNHRGHKEVKKKFFFLSSALSVVRECVFWVVGIAVLAV